MLSVNPCSYRFPAATFKADSDPSWVVKARAPRFLDSTGKPLINRSTSAPMTKAALATMLLLLAAATGITVAINP